ncbi:hypothetical protein H5410_042190, partial [Solanum commersonii]
MDISCDIVHGYLVIQNSDILTIEPVGLNGKSTHFQGQTIPKQTFAIEPVGTDGQTVPFAWTNELQS